MKKTFSIAILALATSVNAQIKIFPGGLQAYGSTTSPPLGEKHHFTGDFVVAEAGGTTAGCAFIKANGSTNPSSVSRPDFSWLGDATTGLFHPGSNLIGLTLGGGEKFRFNSTGQILSSATQYTATPAYSWTVDPNTGFYNPAADMIGFVTNGTEKFRMNSAGQLLNNNSISTASTPDYSWVGSTTTGMFHSGSTYLGFTVGGTEIYRILNNGQILSARVSATASTPDYSWSNDPGTGMYLAGTNLLGFSINASEKLRINSAGQLLNGNSSSSVSTPDYSWSNDPNTGMYRKANDVLSFATGGVEALQIYSNNKVFVGTQPNTGTPSLDGQMTIANVTSGDRALAINHTASAPWQNAIGATVNNYSTTVYGVTYGGSATYYVAGGGWIYSQGNYLGSDINIKDDIHTIDSASAKINLLKGVTYKLKKEKQSPALYGGTAQEYMGVIAQDVEKVAPQAVKTMYDGTKAVSYEMLIGLLIEGFNEQSEKVEQLQAEMNACCAKAESKNTNRMISNSTDSKDVNEDAKSYMKQNKPNPFNKETVIEYNIVENGTASVLVFDMNGKLLKTIAVKIPGKGSIMISANDLNPGMYYYSLIVNDTEVDTKKMILTE